MWPVVSMLIVQHFSQRELFLNVLYKYLTLTLLCACVCDVVVKDLLILSFVF